MNGGIDPNAQSQTGNLLLAGSIVLCLVILAGFLTYFFYCPCERTPGGWLLGEESDQVISDWSFANDVALCQVQVSGGLPHSVNLNCMASNGRLFLSCAQCQGKTWSSRALAHPEARIRIGHRVYPVTLTRIEDPALLDEAWQARANKTGRGASSPRPEHWWSFEGVSR